MNPSIWLFALLVFGIIVLPGMDMAFIASSALLDGRRAGFAAVAGVIAGGLVHVAMGALGLGLLLQLLPGAFNTLLASGALYLGWIGLQLWRGAGALTELGGGRSRTLARTFGRAALTCLLNPKAYVFMLAVFPQFIRPAQGSVAAQALVLAAIIAATQLLVYGTVALGAAALRSGLRHTARLQVVACKAVGALLLLTAAWTLWQGWRPA